MSRELTEKEKAAVDVVKAQEAEVLALRNSTRDYPGSRPESNAELFHVYLGEARRVVEAEEN